MSNQDYGPEGWSPGPQDPGQGYPPPEHPANAQGPQPPPLPKRSAAQPYSPQGYPDSGYQSAQQPSVQYPHGQTGQYPYGQAGQYPPGQANPSNYYNYAQQPQAGGQPGFGAAGPMPPLPPANKGGKGKWIAIGAVVLIVVVIAAWAIIQRMKPSAPESPVTIPGVPSAPATGSTDMDELEVGQCIQLAEVPGSTPDASGDISVTHQVVDCKLAGQFKLKVATVTNGPSECELDYVKYYQSGYLGSQFTSLSICLAPVLDVGVCYVPAAIEGYWTPIDCTDPDADFKVHSEVSGTDVWSCDYPDYSFLLPVPEPGKVYCIVEPLA